MFGRFPIKYVMSLLSLCFSFPPSPQGLTVCKLDRVAGTVLHLSGVDVIHGALSLSLSLSFPRLFFLPPLNAYIVCDGATTRGRCVER